MYVFMDLLLVGNEEEQEKKSNAKMNSKQQNIDIGSFSSKPPNYEDTFKSTPDTNNLFQYCCKTGGLNTCGVNFPLAEKSVLCIYRVILNDCGRSTRGN
jgi:hypothetical protein